MHMIVKFQNGIRAEALLLAGGRDRMRLIVSGQADAIELSKADGYWYTEAGEPVEIEAITAVGDCTEFCAEVQPRTMTA
jgi:hypothetical protein